MRNCFTQSTGLTIGYSLDEILQGIMRFRIEFSGKLALQMMFIEANKDYASEMARVAEQAFAG